MSTEVNNETQKNTTETNHETTQKQDEKVDKSLHKSGTGKSINKVSYESGTYYDKKSSTKGQMVVDKNNNHSQTGTTSTLPLQTTKYTPLNRYDFDMNIIEKWCEVRTRLTPKRRCKHSSFIHQGYLYIFGGIDINQGKLNDIYRIALSSEEPTWEEIKCKGNIPEPIAYHQGVLFGSKYYVICGEDELQLPTNNIYILDLETSNWEKKTFSESDLLPLESHSVVLDKRSETEASIFIFGGYCHGKYLNTLFEYKIESGTCKMINVGKENVPEGRILHAMGIFENDIYIHGGESKGGEYLTDFWKYSIKDSTWSMIELKGNAPKPRSGHSIITYNSKFYLFGGKTGNIHETNELWAYDINKSQFELKHDTLLEQYSEKEIAAMTLQGHQHMEETKKSPKNNNSKTKKGQSSNLAQSKESGSKKGQLAGIKQKFDDDLLKSPNSKSMKNSLIYKMEQIDINVIKSKVSVLLVKSNAHKELHIHGSVPIPRDGHSCCVFENKLVIFGGDRNKFPLNDLYTFSMD